MKNSRRVTRHLLTRSIRRSFLKDAHKQMRSGGNYHTCRPAYRGSFAVKPECGKYKDKTERKRFHAYAYCDTCGRAMKAFVQPKLVAVAL